MDATQKKTTTQFWRSKVKLSGYYLKILQLFSHFELTVEFSLDKKNYIFVLVETRFYSTIR